MPSTPSWSSPPSSSLAATRRRFPPFWEPLRWLLPSAIWWADSSSRIACCACSNSADAKNNDHTLHAATRRLRLHRSGSAIYPLAQVAELAGHGAARRVGGRNRRRRGGGDHVLQPRTRRIQVDSAGSGGGRHYRRAAWHGPYDGRPSTNGHEPRFRRARGLDDRYLRILRAYAPHHSLRDDGDFA